MKDETSNSSNLGDEESVPDFLKGMKSISSEEYYERVRPYAYLDFALVDIFPCFAMGSFSGERAEELLEFCRRNPSFHIVSIVDPCIAVNRYIAGANVYFLSEGESDPNLYFDIKDYFRRIKSLNSGETSVLPNLSKSMDVTMPFIDLRDSKTFALVIAVFNSIAEFCQNPKMAESSLRKKDRNDKK